MTDQCPKCQGLLFSYPMNPTRVEYFRAKCSACGRVWDLDDNMNPVRYGREWLLTMFVTACIVFGPAFIEAVL